MTRAREKRCSRAQPSERAGDGRPTPHSRPPGTKRDQRAPSPPCGQGPCGRFHSKYPSALLTELPSSARFDSGATSGPPRCAGSSELPHAPDRKGLDLVVSHGGRRAPRSGLCGRSRRPGTGRCPPPRPVSGLLHGAAALWAPSHMRRVSVLSFTKKRM